MYVQDIMQKQVVTVTPETRLPDAMRLMRERGFRHLPVIARAQPTTSPTATPDPTVNWKLPQSRRIHPQHHPTT